jgi:hypothetical protein
MLILFCIGLLLILVTLGTVRIIAAILVRPLRLLRKSVTSMSLKVNAHVLALQSQMNLHFLNNWTTSGDHVAMQARSVVGVFLRALQKNWGCSSEFFSLKPP